MTAVPLAEELVLGNKESRPPEYLSGVVSVLERQLLRAGHALTHRWPELILSLFFIFFLPLDLNPF